MEGVRGQERKKGVGGEGRITNENEKADKREEKREQREEERMRRRIEGKTCGRGGGGGARGSSEEEERMCPAENYYKKV